MSSSRTYLATRTTDQRANSNISRLFSTAIKLGYIMANVTNQGSIRTNPNDLRSKQMDKTQVNVNMLDMLRHQHCLSL